MVIYQRKFYIFAHRYHLSCHLISNPNRNDLAWVYHQFKYLSTKFSFSLWSLTVLNASFHTIRSDLIFGKRHVSFPRLANIFYIMIIFDERYKSNWDSIRVILNSASSKFYISCWCRVLLCKQDEFSGKKSHRLEAIYFVSSTPKKLTFPTQLLTSHSTFFHANFIIFLPQYNQFFFIWPRTVLFQRLTAMV